MSINKLFLIFILMFVFSPFYGLKDSISIDNDKRRFFSCKWRNKNKAGFIKLNKNKLDSCIRANEIYFPTIVMQQALLETGNLKSYLCKNCNNLFGMMFPDSRKTTAIGNYKGYAIYKTWWSSVEDYKIWQKERLSDTVTDYFGFLNKVGYSIFFEDYKNKLSKIQVSDKK